MLPIHLRVILAIVIAFIVGFGAGYGAATAILSPQLPKKPILVGAAVPLTGELAREGWRTLKGYELWVRDINERGGLLGRPVKLIYYDDKSDPTTTATLVEKLITVDGVCTVFGSFASFMVLSGSSVAEKHGIPYLICAGTSTKIYERGFKNVFAVLPSVKIYDLSIYWWIRDAKPFPPIRTVAYLVKSEPFSLTSYNYSLPEAKKIGLDVVYSEEFPPGTKDFSPYIIKIKPLNPDLIVFLGHLEDASTFRRQMHELGLKAKAFYATYAPQVPEWGDILGKLADGALAVAEWHSSLKTPGNEEFVRKWKEYTGTEPDPCAALAYAVGEVFEAAVKKAGSDDPKAIRSALASFTKDNPVMTICGPTGFAENGELVTRGCYLIQWINGKIEIVYPPEFATAKPLYPLP
jgi:branched-chain amino acid transport system substrate-binding protein